MILPLIVNAGEFVTGMEGVQENVDVAFANEGHGDNIGQYPEIVEKLVRDKVILPDHANTLLRFEALTEEHANLVYDYESSKDVKARYKECKKELLEEALRQSKADAHQLRLDKEKFAIEADKGEMVRHWIINEYLPTFVRRLHQNNKYKRSFGEAFSLAIDKGFIDGISIGPKDPNIHAILKATTNVNHASSDIFIKTYEKLFDKRYQYVDKVARMYLLDPSGL
ncbi:hypothetical protein Tco_0174540 [Tanacetum coccineum]